MTLEQIGILTGILSAICTGIFFITKNFKESRRKLRNRICGQWGNEGDIIKSKFETHFVELEIDLDIDDGEITGTVRSRNVNSETISPLCSINGKLKFKSAVIKLTHVRHGEQLLYGTAIIKLKKKTLHWKLNQGVADFFPSYTRLHRQGSA
ncbi:hypothetical protein [Aquirufa salirivi]|uniref:Uncharacterized protein n=1 Tax=Aquirufa salirivi TaxID=3104729 RepID=A0ABW8RWA8_9BACT